MLMKTKKQIFHQLSISSVVADVFPLALYSVFYQTAVFNAGK